MNVGFASVRTACPGAAPALLGVAVIVAVKPFCICAGVGSDDQYVSFEVGAAKVATFGAGENVTDGALLERFIVTELPVASNQPLPMIVLSSASLPEIVIVCEPVSMTGMLAAASATPALATTPPSVRGITFVLFLSTFRFAEPTPSCLALPKPPPDGSASYVVTTKSSFPTGDAA